MRYYYKSLNELSLTLDYLLQMIEDGECETLEFLEREENLDQLILALATEINSSRIERSN